MGDIELLTIEEVSKLFKVDANTISTWVHRNKIPEAVMFKIPGKRTARRFIKNRLEAWINGSLQTQER